MLKSYEQQRMIGIIDGHWIGAHAADPRVVALYRRHYSAQDRLHKDHLRNGIVGPSERMILLTVACQELWAWRLILAPEERITKFVRPDQRRIKKGLRIREKTSTYFGGETGVMCSVFRNEGSILSSILIEEAMNLAWEKWPGKRLFTYVWDSRVASVNPGYCYKKAGWTTCGRNKDGRMTILEVYPPETKSTGESFA